MKRLFTIVAVVFTLAMASCSNSDNTVSGYVVGKKHESRHCYVTHNPATHMNTIHNVPERWVLYVADSTAVRTVHVDKCTFDSAIKGETIRLRCGKESN